MNIALGNTNAFGKFIHSFNVCNGIIPGRPLQCEYAGLLAPADKVGWHHELGVALVSARLYELYDGFYDDLYGIGASYQLRKAHFPN